MPTYKIQDHNGNVWPIEGPEGATDEQLIRVLKKSLEYNKFYTPDTTYAPEREATEQTNWWKNANLTDKPKPTFKDALEIGRINTRDNLKETFAELKDSNLTKEEKAARRIERSKGYGRDLPYVDQEQMNIAQKAVSMLPAAAGVVGAGLVGGPIGAGTALLGMAGGGGSRLRGSLEAEGVPTDAAKQIGLVQGVGVPAAQIGAAFTGPVGGAIGIPGAQEVGNEISNSILNQYLQGPQMKTFQQPLDEALLAGGLGALSGRTGQRQPMNPNAPVQGRLTGPGTPPPTGGSGAPQGPSTPPVMPSGGGGRTPATDIPFKEVPKPGTPQFTAARDAAVAATKEKAVTQPNPTMLNTKVRERPDLKIFEQATEAAKSNPIAATHAGRRIVPRPAKGKPTDAKIVGEANVPPVVKAAVKTARDKAGLVTPAASHNPLGPPEVPGYLDSLGTSTKIEPPDISPISVPDDFGAADSLGSPDPSGVMPVVKDTQRGLDEGYLDSLGSATPPSSAKATSLDSRRDIYADKDVRAVFEKWDRSKLNSLDDLGFGAQRSEAPLRFVEQKYLTKKDFLDAGRVADEKEGSRFDKQMAYKEYLNGLMEERSGGTVWDEAGEFREKSPTALERFSATDEGQEMARAISEGVDKENKERVDQRRSEMALVPAATAKEQLETLSPDLVATRGEAANEYWDKWFEGEDAPPQPKGGSAAPSRKSAPRKRAVSKEKLDAGVTLSQMEAKKKLIQQRAMLAKQEDEELPPQEGEEPTSGKQVTQDYFQFDDDIEALDRVWGKSGDVFVPWYLNQMKDPYKIDAKSTFTLSNTWREALKGNTSPGNVANLLDENLPWFSDGWPDPMMTWSDFATSYGPQFLANGFDTFSLVVGKQSFLLLFNPSLATAITKQAAKVITAEKTVEHVRQLRNAQWMKPDPGKGTSAYQEIVLAEIATMLKGGSSVLNILTLLEIKAPSPGLRGLAEQIKMGLARQTNEGILTKILIQTESPRNGNYAGFYQMKEGVGNVTLFVPKGGLSFRTLFHELIHAVTIPVMNIMSGYAKDTNNFYEDGAPVNPALIERYQKLRKRTSEFYAYVQRNVKALPLGDDSDISDFHHNTIVRNVMYNNSAWTENVHEVLAYALTDALFQKLMFNIPVKKTNGLHELTETVREFHGISEDMDNLFYEAVKLFNEFAQFDINLKGGPTDVTADYYAFKNGSNPYAAVAIRGPPDVNKAIGTFVGHYNEVMAMQGGIMPKMYSRGRKLLDLANTNGQQNPQKLVDLFPLRDGNEVMDALTTGQFNPSPMDDAPFYWMGIPAHSHAMWNMARPGVVNKGVHYFLVGNVDNAMVHDAMKANFPDSYMMVDDAAFLLNKKVEVATALKQWEVDSEERQKLALLPDAAIAALPGNIRRALSQQSQYQDPKTVDEALALYKKNPKDLSTTIWNQLVSGSETYATLTDNPLIAFLRGRVSVAISEQVQLSSNLIKPLGIAYDAMTDDEKKTITKILVKGDRSEVEYDDYQLRNIMNLSDNQVRYYKTVRDAANFDYDTWNRKRSEIGLPPVPYRVGYLPSIFEGDYKAAVKADLMDPAGNISTETIGVATAFTKGGFQQVKESILKDPNLKDVYFEDMPKKKMVGAPMPGQLFSVYETLAETLGPTNPEIEKLQSMLQEFAKYDEGRYLGFHVHELTKKGVFGPAGDRPWESDLQNSDNLFSALVRYLEEGSAHHNSLKLMQDMDRIFLDPDLRENGRTPAVNTLTYLHEMYNHLLRHHPASGHKYSPLANLFKSIGTTGDTVIDTALQVSDMMTVPGMPKLSLGVGPTAFHKVSGTLRYTFATWAMGLFNMAFMGLQLLQVPMFAPQMAMLTRRELGLSLTQGREHMMYASLTLARYIANMSLKDVPKVGNKLGVVAESVWGSEKDDAELSMVFRYAEDNNLINFTDIERAIEKSLSPKASRVDRFLNANQRYAEVMTRPLVFLWMYKLEREGGIPMKEALEIARHKTQFVMVPYDLRDRPMAYASMGAYGMALGQLKTYGHSSISQTWFYIKNVKTKKSIAPAVYTAMIGMVIQGQMGLIGMQDIDNLVRSYNTTWNNKNQGIREVIAENLPLAVERGLASEWSNIDFYSRLRSPPMIQSPLIETLIPPSAAWTAGVVKSFSYMLSDVNKVELNQWMNQANTQKGILGVTPPAFKYIPEQRFSVDGHVMKYSDGEKPLKGYKRSEFDWTLRKYGLRSTEESLHQESKGNRNTDAFLRALELKELKQNIREIVRKKDYKPEELTKARKEFFDAGGDPKEYISIVKNPWAASTEDEKFFGKPSKGRAWEYMQREKIEKERER
jgi:hypothetical protein